MTRRIVCALLLFIGVFPVTLGQTKSRVHSLRGPSVEAELLKKLQTQPNISVQDLAVFGNQLIITRGFDYMVDSCSVVGRVTKKERDSDVSLHRRTSLVGLDGKLRTFAVDVSDPDDGLCGECDLFIPALKFTRRELVLPVDGQFERFQRPKHFGTEDALLVDSSMKKVLRRWTMPHQSVPSAISADATKLYVSFYSQELDKLFIELSDDGGIRLVPAADIKMSSQPEWIEEGLHDPNNAYLSFIKFHIGRNTHIVRFNAPCT